MHRVRFLSPALVLVFLVAPAAAATWHVPTDFATIGAATIAATAGDTVLVACGGYAEGDIVVPAGIVLRSESGSPDCVVVDAQAAARNLICDGADGASIEGLNLLGGMGDGGGCVRIAGGSPRFVNCRFSAGVSFSGGGGASCTGGAAPVFIDCEFLGNTAANSNGGGLFAVDASPVLVGCLFRGNLASSGDGGGIYMDRSSLDLQACTFFDNRSTYGGGLIAYASSGSVTGCEFRENVAENGGGGAHLAWAPVTLEATDFLGNRVVQGTGGGLKTGGYDVIGATDCTFTANTAASGGGIHGGSDLDLVRCTVTGNEATGSGGGIALFGGLHMDADSTTILGNSGPDPADGFVPVNSTAYLHCCEIEPANWFDWAAITRDDAGCTIPVSRSTWGDLKARFR